MLLTVQTSQAAAQEWTEVTFCNRTGSTTYAAFAYYNIDYNEWYIYAWLKMQPHQCRSAGAVGTGEFYYFAEKSGRGYHWPAERYVQRRYCVPDYAINRYLPGGQSCRNDERILGFAKADVYGRNFTVNLR